MTSERVIPVGICGGLEAAPAAGSAGADYLEVSVQGFLDAADEDAALFEANLAASAGQHPPVRRANLFLPARLPCIGPAADEAALLAYAERAFARAQRTGIGCIVFGSGGARTVPPGVSAGSAREQFVALLRNMAPLAESAGITLVVEPLNTRECNFVNTLAEGADIVAACGHPAVGLVADTYHMGFSGEGPDAVRRFGTMLRHFHVAEYPSRRYPGADGQDYVGWFEVLREVGYSGGVSVECRWGDLDAEAGLAVANLRRDLAAAGYDGEPEP